MSMAGSNPSPLILRSETRRRLLLTPPLLNSVKGEQATALATSTSSSLQASSFRYVMRIFEVELAEWNAKYRQKFGLMFLICASGKSTEGILAELKKRYPNRPVVDFEIAAQEQMKITELRLVKLFATKENISSTGNNNPTIVAKKVEDDRVSIIGGHLTAASEASSVKTSQAPARTRPPITTHVLDVSRGSPGSGIEACLEM